MAFGTGTNDPGRMYEYFATQVHQGMPVLIHVTTTGEGEYHGYVFSHKAVFVGTETDEKKVAHLRPETAFKSDTPHGFFWIVKDFEMLPKEEFVSFSKLKVSPPLHGPTVKAGIS